MSVRIRSISPHVNGPSGENGAFLSRPSLSSTRRRTAGRSVTFSGRSSTVRWKSTRRQMRIVFRTWPFGATSRTRSSYSMALLPVIITAGGAALPFSAGGVSVPDTSERVLMPY